MKIAIYSLPLAFWAVTSNGTWLVYVFMLIELKMHTIRVADQLTSLFIKQKTFGVVLFKKTQQIYVWMNKLFS